MNTANFSEYLQNPSLLYQITYEELKTLIVQYPYSQNLRYLIAQKSNMENNTDYEHFLRSAAIISTDRVHLYHILKTQKAEPATEDNFILEEETLELKELNQLDLNQVELEPVTAEMPSGNLDLNASDSLERQETVFDTFPELSPTLNSDLEESIDLNGLEQDISLPRLEEESIADLLEEADSVSDEVAEDNAIEALIDATATEAVVGVAAVTSIASLLGTEETTNKDVIETEEDSESTEVEIGIEVAAMSDLETETPENNVVEVASTEKVEEVSLQDLFETETPELTENDKEATNQEEIEATNLRFTPPPPARSIQELLGSTAKKMPKRRKRRSPKVLPIAPSHFHQETVQDVVEQKVVVEQKAEAIAQNLKRKEEQVEEYASKSIEESMDIASETYANLLIRQNQPEKAIQVYERLKLIFPEKSAFFAQQIENLGQKL